MSVILYNPHVAISHDRSGNHVFSILLIMEPGISVFYRIKGSNADPGTGVPADSVYNIEFFFGTPTDPTKWHNISDLGNRVPISVGSTRLELARFKRRIDNMATAKFGVTVAGASTLTELSNNLLEDLEEDVSMFAHNGTIHFPGFI